MHSAPVFSTLLVIALAFLPTIIASYISGPRDWEPEHEYDYR